LATTLHPQKTMAEITPSDLLRNAFLDLSENDIRALSEKASFRTWPAGDYVCREGETGTTLFILGKGEVDIIVHAEDDEDILVDTIGENSYFGEMAFLGETTRMATVRTRTPCILLEIDQADFMAVARTNPTLLRTLLRQIIGHLRRNDQAVIKELNIKNNALRKAYADLAEQENLRTQFIATLSHELRTPLTSIKGFLGLVNQGAIQGDSLKVALESITRNVDTMVGLTNDLLILYEMHPAAPEYAYFNVADVLIEALNVAKEVLNGQAPAVKVDIAPGIPEIYADKRALTLAVRALIENALKFNPEGAPVTIHATSCGESELAISVEDQGVGIPAEEFERVFEPFVRVETEGSTHLFPGLGVGLTIARFVIVRHGGRITVDSQLGVGSTFTIILPLIASAINLE
jgi:signal transduction histidine kinase